MKHGLAGVLALLFSVPVSVGAVEVDVRGPWQLNLNCDLNATASLFLLLDEDSASGAVTGDLTDCGTFEVPLVIRRPLSCVTTPSPLVGRVTGTDFVLPTTGSYASDALIPAFPFLTCNPATRLRSAHRLSGGITADDAGRAIRIDGTWQNASVEFHDPSGSVCWSMTDARPCTFAMRRNDLPVGDDVAVSPRDGTTITFEHVTAPGTVGVVPLTDAAGGVPAHFKVVGPGSVPIFYDVSTTATFTGTVTSCFPYPDANGDGLVDGTNNPPVDETDLRMLHEEGGVFVDRTVSLDTTAKIICGVTTSLSQLAVAHLPPAQSRDYRWTAGKLVLVRKRSGREMGSFVGSLSGRWGFPFPVPGSSNDPRQTGAVFDLFSGTEGEAHFPMPEGGWKASGNGGTFRFHNAMAPNADSPVAAATLDRRRRRMKMESRAVGLALAGPQTAIGVRLTVGSLRYCGIYRHLHLRRDLANRVVAEGYAEMPPDCADKRMRWAVRQ